MNSLPTFSSHLCPVYLCIPYMNENSIKLARQDLQAIKSSFKSILLRVECKTNHQLNGIVKNNTSPHELSNIVYVFSFHCGNDYVNRTYQHMSAESSM